MAEYINRDAALDIVNGWREQLIPTYGKNDEYVKCLETVAEHLETLPAADVVERKTGKWIHDVFGENKMPIVKCSECGLKEVWYEEEGMGFALHGQKYANFCPNCGAEMSGGDEDEEPPKEET